MDERAMGPAAKWAFDHGQTDDMANFITFDVEEWMDFARETDSRIAKLEAENARLRAAAAPCRHDWRDVLSHLAMVKALRAGRYDGGDPGFHTDGLCAICSVADARG